MRLRQILLGLAVAATTCAPAYAAMRPCVVPEAAGSMIGKDVCVRAHVYDVVTLRSGTRFLDVCSPETPNSECRFTIISLVADEADVGPLEGLRGTEIEIRGHVRNFPDHREIVLSNMRQLHGGPEKFRPNAELLGRYSASEHSLAFRDPNVRSGGKKTGTKPLPVNNP